MLLSHKKSKQICCAQHCTGSAQNRRWQQKNGLNRQKQKLNSSIVDNSYHLMRCIYYKLLTFGQEINSRQKNAVFFIRELFINVQSIVETRPVKRISGFVDFVCTNLGPLAWMHSLMMVMFVCFVGKRVEEWICLQFGCCRVHRSICSFRPLVCSKQCNTLWIKPDSYAVNVLKSISSVCALCVMYWLFSAWGAIACYAMPCHAYATANINTVVNNMLLILSCIFLISVSSHIEFSS